MSVSYPPDFEKIRANREWAQELRNAQVNIVRAALTCYGCRLEFPHDLGCCSEHMEQLWVACSEYKKLTEHST